MLEPQGMADLVDGRQLNVEGAAAPPVADLPALGGVELDIPGDPVGLDVVRGVRLGERPIPAI